MSEINGKTCLTKTKYYKFEEYLKTYIIDDEFRNKLLEDFKIIMDFNPNNPQKTKEQYTIMLQKKKENRLVKKTEKELEKELENIEKRKAQHRFKTPIND